MPPETYVDTTNAPPRGKRASKTVDVIYHYMENRPLAGFRPLEVYFPKVFDASSPLAGFRPLAVYFPRVLTMQPNTAIPTASGLFNQSFDANSPLSGFLPLEVYLPRVSTQTDH